MNTPTILVAHLGPKFRTQTAIAAQDFVRRTIIPMHGNECEIEFLTYPSMGRVIRAFQTPARPNYAVVCIENNCDGFYADVAKAFAEIAINPSYETECPLRIIDELRMPVVPKLFARPDCEFDSIETIYSQPSVIRQCSKFVDRFAEERSCRVVMLTSSGDAADMYVNDVKGARGVLLGFDSNSSGLGSLLRPITSKELGLEWTRKRAGDDILTDRDDSETRFWLLSCRSEDQFTMLTVEDKPETPGIEWKSCYLLVLDAGETGNLHEAIGKFSSKGNGAKNSVRVSSLFPSPRPGKTERKFEYVFYIEVEGAHYEKHMRSAFDSINHASNGDRCIFLGSYPDRPLKLKQT